MMKVYPLKYEETKKGYEALAETSYELIEKRLLEIYSGIEIIDFPNRKSILVGTDCVFIFDWVLEYGGDGQVHYLMNSVRNLFERNVWEFEWNDFSDFLTI